jgi:hypothetical protein
MILKHISVSVTFLLAFLAQESGLHYEHAKILKHLIYRVFCDFMS